MTADPNDPLATMQPAPGHPRPPRWRVLWLPAAIALGFAAVFALVLAPSLLPATPVTAVPAVALPLDPSTTTPSPDSADQPAPSSARAAEPRAIADAPTLFQAAGWIEPDPQPIHVPALVSGIVEHIHVIEGDPVEAGQLLATLVAEDAELDLAAAEADLREAEAMVESARATAEAATATIALRQQQVAVAEPQLEAALDRQQRFERIETGAIAQGELIQAQLEAARRQAELNSARADIPVAEAEQRRAKAQLALAEAGLEAAAVARERARLMLDRSRITAPLDGVVLRLRRAPGTRVMLDGDHHDAATIAILYQPDHLQVRVDVPLNQVTSVRLGQAAVIRSDLLPDQAMPGRVTSIGGEADIQRNSLQVKVRVDDPDPRLRPDMLCRVSFLDATAPGAGPPADAATATSEPAPTTGPAPATRGGGARLAIMIPEAALLPAAARPGNGTAPNPDSEPAALVWVVDLDQRAELRQVKPGPLRRGDAIQILDGMRAGEPVIIDPPADLKPGRRLAVTIPAS